jgi:hypothetical protein
MRGPAEDEEVNARAGHRAFLVGGSNRIDCGPDCDRGQGMVLIGAAKGLTLRFAFSGRDNERSWLEPSTIRTVVPIRGYPMFILADARNYILALPSGIRHQDEWQHTASF